MPPKPTHEKLEQRVKELEKGEKRKQIEKALWKNDEKYRLIFNTAPIGICHFDSIGVITECNPQFTEMVGASYERLIGFNMLKNVTDQKMLYAIRTCLSGKQSIFEGEYTSVTGGKTTFAKANFVPVISKNNTVIGGVGIIEDVTTHVKAHEAIKKSEEMYRNIIENITDVYYRADIDGNLTMASPSGVKLLGYDGTEQMIGKNIAKEFYADPKDRKRFEKEIMKHGKIRFQCALKRKDGKIIITETVSRLIYDETGKPIAVDGIFRDITERIKSEEMLRESEERFRQLAEGTFEAIVLHKNGIIIEANNQYYKMFGYEPHELAGKDVISLTTTSESVKQIRKKISSHNLGPYELTGVKKDGTKFPIESRVQLIEYKGHKVRMAAMRDLTEQKQTEKALLESEARFKDTATMLPSVIIEYGLDGILTYVNPHGYKLAGYEPGDFQEGFHVLQLAAPEEHEKHYERIQKLMRGEKLLPAEYRLIRKDGSTFWGLVTSNLIKKDGEVVGIRTYTIDISEQKAAEEALKERTRELELKTKSLEEINTAMKVLLKKREEDKLELEDNILTNVRELIAPYFDKIKTSQLDDQQKAYLSIIESNMNEIISPFTRRLSLTYLKLTPTEIKIANMIKHGHTTKKIAKMMNISPRTVDTHRKNIRTKVGLESKGANLRSYLLTLH